VKGRKFVYTLLARDYVIADLGPQEDVKTRAVLRNVCGIHVVGVRSSIRDTNKQ
jgi:hypothetical protein